METKCDTEAAKAHPVQPNTTSEETSSEAERSPAQKAIDELVQLLEDKFGGLGFSTALKKSLYPTICLDLTRADDEQRVPQIANARETRDIAEAQKDAVDTIIETLSAWYPVYWYLRMQRDLSDEQVLRWEQTREDLREEGRHGQSIVQRTWRVICSPLNFLRHFSKHPLSSIVTVFLLVWWEFCLIWALVVPHRLRDWAFFVGAFGTNSRSQVLIASCLLYPNLPFLVLLRWANKRGLTPFGSILPYGIIAFTPLSYLYGDDAFMRTVLAVATVRKILMLLSARPTIWA